MQLFINGEAQDTPEGLSVAGLLEQQDVEMPDMVSVELNDEILKREDFDSIVVKDGDRVEFLYFMGGGGRSNR